MKRILFVMLLAVCLLGSFASAESRSMEYTASVIKQRFLCETFDADMNADAQEAFSARLLPGDAVVCGAEMMYYSEGQNPDVPFHKGLMMVVRRKDRMLMLAASGSNGAWESQVESDAFLSAGDDFALTFSPDDRQTVLVMPYMALIRGDERWEFHIGKSGQVLLDGYAHQIDEHTRLVLDMTLVSYDASFCAALCRDGESEVYEEFASVFPRRMAAWTMDEFPKTMEEVRVYAQAHQPDVGEDRGYIFGVNLRRKPTGQSESMGKYTAKVKVLGNVPGKDCPWYNVQVGDLTGWVSGRYLVQKNCTRLCEAACEIVPVARADRDIALKSASTGETVMTVPAGTLMHVIHQEGDRLHVILPRAELTWKTDWDGTYGMISAEDVTCGMTPADVRRR